MLKITELWVAPFAKAGREERACVFKEMKRLLV